MYDNLLNLIFALFILSMLSERVAEWLKFQPWFKKFFGIMNTTLKLPSAIEEQKRYFRILKINIGIAILVALAVRADLFYLLQHEGTTELGWPRKLTDLYPTGGFWRFIQIILGCVCTGFFLSFGSKLWHDLLDIVLAFKEAKRQVSAGFPVNNPANFDLLAETEKDAAIKGAIETFGNKWRNTIDGYAGTGVGRKMIDKKGVQTNDLVLEFYVDKKKDNASDIVNAVPAFVNYGGINIPTDVKEKDTDITPQWLNPGGDHTPARPGESISRVNQLPTGTMSLKVTKQEDDGTTGTYVLSCYHVLFGSELQRGLLAVSATSVLSGDDHLITPGTFTRLPGESVARAKFGCINEFVDAAVALLDEKDSISDQVDELGKPQNIHSVSGADVLHLRVNFCGAKSGKKTGLLIKACNQNRPYKISKAHPNLFLNDLIELDRCSEEGDSGAPVMDDQKNIIGIIIGADRTSTYIVPIQNIINNLKVFPLLTKKIN